jgi:glutaredoxin 3
MVLASRTRKPIHRRASSALNSISTIRKYLTKHAIVVFTKSYCPCCREAVQKLSTYGKQYNTRVHVVELDTLEPSSVGHQLHQRLIKMTGRTTVPNVFIGGAAVGGCDEVKALDRSHKLRECIQKAVRKQASPKARRSRKRRSKRKRSS